MPDIGIPLYKRDSVVVNHKHLSSVTGPHVSAMSRGELAPAPFLLGELAPTLFIMLEVTPES